MTNNPDDEWRNWLCVERPKTSTTPHKWDHIDIDAWRSRLYRDGHIPDLDQQIHVRKAVEFDVNEIFAQHIVNVLPDRITKYGYLD